MTPVPELVPVRRRPTRWWADPVDPYRWFPAERIARSESYAAPRRRAVLVRALVTAVALALLSTRMPWWEAAGAAVAGAAVGWALWLPGLIVDTWSEYYHEPRFGSTPLPRSRYLSAVGLTAMVITAIGAAVAVGFGWVVARTPWWPVLIGSVWAVFMLGVGPALVRHRQRFEPLAGTDDADLGALARWFGLGRVQFGRLGAGPDRAEPEGINAVSLGMGRPLVLCSDALLAAGPPLREFVVAHELAHLRHRHHRRGVLVSVATSAVELAGLWALWRWSGLDRWVGGLDDPRAWPVAVGALAAMSSVTGVLEAWLARAYERQADDDALGLVGSPGEAALRQLLDHDRSELVPRAPWRWWMQHPAPAERLARAAAG